MTTLTLRYIRGDFLLTGPDIEPRKFESRRAAKDWSSTHYPDSPIREVGRGASEWAIRPPPRKPGQSEPGRSLDWLKFKNPEARAVRREAEEDWRK